MLASLVVIGASLLGQAEKPDKADLALEVRRLVRKLDSRQLADREAAEQDLIELGIAALDHLPDAEDRAYRVSAEVAQRVERIRQKLQRKMAAETTDGSRITLKGDEMPLSEVFAAIEEQTGNKVVDRRKEFGPPGEEPKLAVDYDDAPFWPAMDRILDQAGLSLYGYGEEKGLNIVPRSEDQLPRFGRATYSGPFRFEPTRIEAVRDLRNPTAEVLSLWIEISWEPRTVPISLQFPLDRIKAVDQSGDPLPLDSRQTKLEIPGDSESMTTELRIPFELPSREVTKIARIEGTLKTLVQGKIEDFRFENLTEAKDVEKRTAGVTVTLQQVRKNRELWEFRLLIHFDETSGALASHRNWVFENEALLVKPDGEEMAYHAFDTTLQTKNEVGIAYLFALEEPLDDYAFVYRSTGLIMSTDFEFEISEVELP
jgi:hypothetical protein